MLIERTFLNSMLVIQALQEVDDNNYLMLTSTWIYRFSDQLLVYHSPGIYYSLHKYVPLSTWIVSPIEIEVLSISHDQKSCLTKTNKQLKVSNNLNYSSSFLYDNRNIKLWNGYYWLLHINQISLCWNKF
jgi:hypothetical protein